MPPGCLSLVVVVVMVEKLPGTSARTDYIEVRVQVFVPAHLTYLLR